VENVDNIWEEDAEGIESHIIEKYVLACSQI
jgi:hypothetical protein